MVFKTCFFVFLFVCLLLYRAEKAWSAMLGSSSKWKAEDPPITNNGMRIAREAATKILDLVNELSSSIPRINEVRIYSSRLIRAVQTAHQIALHLNLPIYLSTGLATISASVAKKRESFPFFSADEIKSICPGVEYRLCDLPKENEDFIPTDNWRNALQSICLKRPNTLNIIVSHREMIRKLAGKKLNTPYCCTALFQPTLQSKEVRLREMEVKKKSGKKESSDTTTKLPAISSSIKSSSTSKPPAEGILEAFKDLNIDRDQLELKYTMITREKDHVKHTSKKK